MSNLIFRDQRSFMKYFGQEPSEQSAELYKKLCAEEYDELETAWGKHKANPDIDSVTEIADACLDLIYVATGLMHSLGLDPQPLWDEVHRSNIDKIKHPCLTCNTSGWSVTEDSQSACDACRGTGHLYEVRRREDGKVLKPSHWRAPALRPLVVLMLGPNE